MPGGKTRFNSAWLTSIDVNGQRLSGWCRAGADEHHGYCRFCNIDIKCDNAGKSQLLQHAHREKQISAIMSVVDRSQTKLFVALPPATSSDNSAASCSSSSDKTLTTINYNDAVLRAEIYWLAKVSFSN